MLSMCGDAIDRHDQMQLPEEVRCLFIHRLEEGIRQIRSTKLTCKLKRLSLSERAVDLMSSYLLNRQTATTIGTNISSLKSIKVGVPQGYNLGPLQFVVYINDLLNVHFIGKEFPRLENNLRR